MSKNAQFWSLPQKLQHCKNSWVDLTQVMLEFQCYDLHTNKPLLDLVLQLCKPIWISMQSVVKFTYFLQIGSICLHYSRDDVIA